MPDDESRVIYGDGTNLATVGGGKVTISHAREGNVDGVTLSEEAFREIVLGWTRYQEEKHDA